MSGLSVRRDVGTRVPVVRRRGGERVNLKICVSVTWKCNESKATSSFKKAKQGRLPATVAGHGPNVALLAGTGTSRLRGPPSG